MNRSKKKGIFAQSDESVLTDVAEFYFGGQPSWIHRRTLDVNPTIIHVVMDDPEEEEGTTKDYPLTADQIRTAYDKARTAVTHGASATSLCCSDAIGEEDGQLGMGCADDLDVILQYAAYGEIVFG